jgi:polysaccharide biosynthesis transport protein
MTRAPKLMESSHSLPVAIATGEVPPEVRPTILEEPEGDLGRTVNILWRRKNIVIGCVVLISAICIAAVYAVTPQYTAESALVIEPRKTNVIDIQSVVSGLPADVSVVRSEVEILQSSAIAGEVVKRLHLDRLPAYNPTLGKASVLDQIQGAVSGMLARVGPLLGVSAAAPARGASAVMQEAMRRLQSQTDIVNDGRSYYLKIRVTSPDPKLAADLANAYADVYLDQQLQTKFNEIRRANNWLDKHIAELKAKVQASDEAVAAFRTAHHLIGARGETITQAQLGEINQQLITAKAELAKKEANLRGASGAAIAADPVTQKLREQLAELVTKEADLATRYKPDHPEMLNIKAQERDLQREIAAETGRIVQGMAGEVAAAKAQVEALQASLVQLQSATAAQGTDDVQLRELQREADANRLVYQDFLNRFKQTTAQADIQQPDARLVAIASPPDQPSFPRKLPLIGAAFVGSLIIGCFAAFATERLDNTFRTGEQIDRIAHVPVLAVVPNVNSAARPQDEVVDEPFSVFSETIRMVRTGLRYSSGGAPPKVVMVTSSLPEEGKTVMAISLARSAAFSGVKTLLIDCDLRKPSVAKMLGVTGGRGILSLFDDGGAADIIEIDQKSGLHYVTAIEGPPNVQTLLSSKPVEDFFDGLRREYDLIIIDSPPVMAVSDAMILCHLADTSIILVRWAHTPRPVVLGALRNFRAIGGRVSGAVLSRVDLAGHAAYRSGDLVGYYGDASKYGYGYASSARKT